MTALLLGLPGWALVGLMTGALAGGAVLGAFVDRRLRPVRPDEAAVETPDHLRDERLQLAAELHQAVSHEVSAVLLHSAGARAVPSGGDPRVAAALDLITQASTSCMHELARQRDVLQGLGNTATGATGNCDLSSVGDLVARARKHGVRVRVRSSGVPGILDPSIGRTAYLVVADALHHAETAQSPEAELGLSWRAHSLELRIRVGGNLSPRAAGTHTVMADRVRLLGGDLKARSHPGGELLTLTLPVRPHPPVALDTAATPAEAAH